MAKRYYQDYADRRDEHKGMEGKRKSYSGYYEGEAARHTQEAEDGGMIREDRRAIANLPQEVMIKPYPMTGPYMPENLDDTIAGVDRQMDMDDRQRSRTFDPHKY